MATEINARRSLRGLDWFNFFIADVQGGIGPFLAIYLVTARHWNPAQVGLIVAVQGVSTVLAQGPAGWIVDWAPRKKWLLIIAAIVVALGCLETVAAQSVGVQFVTQSIIGVAGAFFPPCIAAISLGIVGKQRLSRRAGRNDGFNHSGNVVSAVLAGVAGTFLGQDWIFYCCAFLAIGAIVSAGAIRNSDIDNRQARAGATGTNQRPVPIRRLFSYRRILIFTASVLLFHLANAAMLPLVGEDLTRMSHASSPIFMSACVIIAQLVMAPIAILVGRHTDQWGRKPIFAAAFAALATRGILFSQVHSSGLLLSVQTLDGVGAGIFGVLWVIIISDLAKGTGRFNVLQGAIQMALGAGASTSNWMAGIVAHRYGFSTAFLFLAGIAVIGLLFFTFLMPETKGEARAEAPETAAAFS